MSSTTRKSKTATPRPAKAADSKDRRPSRLDQLEVLLAGPEGTSIAEMTAATGWQAHSVHGAMPGALKKHGLAITSRKVDGVRRYRAVKPQ